MKYADDVISGKIKVCKWTHLAVERHLRDLETGKHRGLYFDEAAAAEVFEVFKHIRHWKGEWAGQPLVLEPWQEFRNWVLFGWKRADGFRRFREAYTEVARKNGKTTEAAGIGIKLAFFDGEPGAEVYSAATKRDQARISHNDAKRMVKASPDLGGMIKCLRDNLHDPLQGSKFEPLGGDADSLDGLNIHGVIIDELHAHKTRQMLDVLDTATGSRRQPMLYEITTAGDDLTSVCYQQHTYARRVLSGAHQDDRFFAWIACLDDEDEWQDEDVWIKANPNLGASVKLDDLRTKAAKAAQLPAAQNAFLRLHCNRWVHQVTRWLSLEAWNACVPVDPTDRQGVRAHCLRMEQELADQECIAGLDLGYVQDMTAFELLFRQSSGVIRVISRFWMPEESIRIQSERIPDIEIWAREGWITPTAGNAVDYRKVREDIEALGRRYKIQEIAFDRMFAGQLAQDLDDAGFAMCPINQGFSGMSTPSRELEALILDGKIDHGGHPVLRWMADCVAVQENTGGQIRPIKPERGSFEKVDGIVALIMALGRVILDEAPGPSVYQARGLVVL